jgi:hypothetical protein
MKKLMLCGFWVIAGLAFSHLQAQTNKKTPAKVVVVKKSFTPTEKFANKLRNENIELKAKGKAVTINSANGTAAKPAENLGTGLYIFTGNGNWNVASNWANSLVPVNPLPSGNEIVIDHQLGGACLLNVPYTVGAGGKITIKSGKSITIPGNLCVYTGASICM